MPGWLWAVLGAIVVIAIGLAVVAVGVPRRQPGLRLRRPRIRRVITSPAPPDEEPAGAAPPSPPGPPVPPSPQGPSGQQQQGWESPGTPVQPGSGQPAAGSVPGELRDWDSYSLGAMREQEISRAQPQPAAGPPGPPAASRYANATLLSMPWQAPWPREQSLEPAQRLLLRVDIGPLSERSQVQAPVPFPDEYLPGGDLTIDVAVTSETFWIGRGLGAANSTWGQAQQGSFLLPGDGGPARTADGQAELLFELLTPPDPGPARLRIIYYCRGAVVQSQVLVAEIGTVAPGRPAPGRPAPDAAAPGGAVPGDDAAGGRWSLRTDYTIAESLPSAARIPDRPRVAVVLHQDAAGQALFARRDGAAAAGFPAASSPVTAVTIPPALAGRVQDLRKLLASEAIAPVAVRRSKAQLVQTLRALAPVGWELYAGLFPSLRETFYTLGGSAAATGTGAAGSGAGPAVLHVARPAGVGLSVPWAYLYTIGIDSGYAANGFRDVPLCPLVGDWDGRGTLVTEDLTSCPQAGTVSHASNLLCPFGFLGLRHDIEQLSSSQRPVLSIEAPSGSRVVIAETAYQVSAAALGAHVTTLRTTVAARLPGVSCLETTSKAMLAELISADLPLVYFYCHGERPNAASPETFLGIGKREWVTAPDFMSWVQDAYLRSGLRVWDQVRPLVFINACHSAEIDPRALFNYVDAFVGVGNAAGVIGTEVKVHQDLAMRFAQAFFGELLADGGTVGVALRRARLRFLAGGNLFGLNYTPYCWADLTITEPS